MAAARERQGRERLEQIQYAVLEQSGGISIVPREKENPMPSDVGRGPRRYLLVVMAVSLLLLVPLMFLLITLVGGLVEPDPGGSTINGWVILWALLGLAVAALVVGSIVMMVRGTRQARLEHEPPRAGDRPEL